MRKRDIIYRLYWAERFPLELLGDVQQTMTEPQISALMDSLADGMINPLYVKAEYGRFHVHPGQNRVIALRRMHRKYAQTIVYTRYSHFDWPFISPERAAAKFSGNLVAEWHDPRFFAVKLITR